MLANLYPYRHNVSLVRDSGIQFLDFGLTPTDSASRGCFVRKTANGPLLRLAWDDTCQKFTLPAHDGSAPEVVEPESRIALSHSLTLLDGEWLPLPVLRVSAQRRFAQGPGNWARFQIRELAEPDEAGHTHRLTLALDTRIVPEEDSAELLAPVSSDITFGTRFALAWHDDELADFIDQVWVDGWLRDSFSAAADERETRAVGDIQQALKKFEYQAHWLNLLELFGTELAIPELRIVETSTQTAAIPVDLVLDVGNTHTCGILVEDHGIGESGLRHAAELRVRSPDAPQYVSPSFFSSRLTFARADFGRRFYSVESGRDDAFVWPSLVRTGDEACFLAAQRHASTGACSLSSPRRYLWDCEPAVRPWRFSKTGASAEAEAIALPLMMLMNDEGIPLTELSRDERLPVFSAEYSRSALMTQLLCELLTQALSQINSVDNRLSMGQPDVPRQLRTLILTLPTGMPVRERDIFRQRMEEAIGMVWRAMGWHPDEVEPSRAVPLPAVEAEWDEASCGQMFWLYNEIQQNYAGRADALFRALARANTGAERTLRVASIDIGGGTTDMAVTEYSLREDDSRSARITPRLLFREGFRIAGDDILLDVIRHSVLPALANALRQGGVRDVDGLMSRLAGDAVHPESGDTLRQQMTLQYFIPLGNAILAAWEHCRPDDRLPGLDRLAGDMLSHKLSAALCEEIAKLVQPALAEDAPAFDLMAVPVQVNFNELQQAVLERRFAIATPLHALCEAVSFYDCDVVLLTGRPIGLPGVQALLRYLQPVPVNRMVMMNDYPVHEWYPFNGHPKSTAAVGAMLFSLSQSLRLPGFLFQTSGIQAYSTIRYLGVLDEHNRLTDDNIWYRDIDLDNPRARLDSEKTFAIRGNVRLGFRQLDNERWPASPLYTLAIVDPSLTMAIASQGPLYVRLALRQNAERDGEAFMLGEARLASGEKVSLDKLSLTLNTLSDSRGNVSDYWIDSGSLYKK
ncbi:virulence factor SrfB [Enterobacteriaceae bacterium 4M9]|nr:virulence factor SrfB [Enterobacteriaceae bacterium 4M9]